MSRKVDFKNDGILKLIIKLAVPTMIAQLVMVLYNMIDRMFIGHIPEIGDLALAGVGVCAPIVTLIVSFGVLVGIGGSILMSIKLGEGHLAEARRILANSFLMLCAMAAGLTVLFLLLKEKLLMAFGASLITFPYANTYLTIYTIGAFFAILAVGLNYFITCQGFSVVSMTAVAAGALSNIVMDYLFIFVLDWSVAGAVWATVFAQMLSCSISAGFLLFGKKVPIKITFSGYDARIIRRILYLGISPFIIWASDSALVISLNASLQHFGGTQGDLLISAATVVQSYMQLITGPMTGITSGTQPIISYHYGAQNSKKVKQAEKSILIMCFIFTTAMFIVSRTSAQYFAALFTKDAALQEMSVWGIKAFTLTIIPLSCQYVFVEGLTALSRVKTALCLSMFRKSFYVVLTFVLPLWFAAKSAFYAEPISDFASSVVSTIVFLCVFQKHLTRREQEVIQAEVE